MESHVSQPGDRIRVAKHGQESLNIATVRLFGEHFLRIYFLALGRRGTHTVTRPEYSS
jgi:hypothetical protein